MDINLILFAKSKLLAEIKVMDIWLKLVKKKVVKVVETVSPKSNV